MKLSLQRLLSDDKSETLGDVPVIIALDKQYIHFLPPASSVSERCIVPICSLDITFAYYLRMDEKVINS